MGKEQPDKGNKPGTVLIRLSECHLPGTETSFRASVPIRPLIDIEKLAERLAENGYPLRKETLVLAYRLMNSEVYKALEDGHNVDIGLGKVELQTSGRYDSKSGIIADDDKTKRLVPNFRSLPDSGK